MRYHLFRYTCENCGNVFKAPELGFDAYGEFLLRSSSGETAYLNAMSDPVFSEVDVLLKKLPNLQNKSAVSIAEVQRSVFGVACDPDSSGATFSITMKPKCSKCGCSQSAYWEATEPPEYVDEEFPHVTHDHWQSLSEDQKLELLENVV